MKHKKKLKNNTLSCLRGSEIYVDSLTFYIEKLKPSKPKMKHNHVRTGLEHLNKRRK